MGLDISRSSSAPPNQHHQANSSRFSNFGPGYDSPLSPTDLTRSESSDYLSANNNNNGNSSSSTSTTNHGPAFMTSPRQDPRSALQQPQSSSSVYSPGPSWQLWSSTTTLSGQTGGSDDTGKNSSTTAAGKGHLHRHCLFLRLNIAIEECNGHCLEGQRIMLSSPALPPPCGQFLHVKDFITRETTEGPCPLSPCHHFLVLRALHFLPLRQYCSAWTDQLLFAVHLL